MFCDQFKKYRRMTGMTQEEVARFLMVTPQAVSKWETGNGTPDISLLAPIADLFCVTTDELLGRALTDPDSALEEIYHATEEAYRERYGKCLRLLKHNPQNEKILFQLLSISAEWLSSEKEQLSAAETAELISAARGYAQALHKKGSCATRTRAHGLLANIYMAVGEFSQAREEIEGLPSSRYTRSRMLGNLAVTEKDSARAREFFRESISDTLPWLFWDMERIAQSYSAVLHEDFKTNRSKMDEIYGIEYAVIHAIGAEGMPLLRHHLCNASIRLAQKAIWSGDHETAFAFLDEFMTNARSLRSETVEPTAASSLILSDCPHAVRALSKESVLFRLSWNAFNPLRTDPRFIRYIEEVEAWEDTTPPSSSD
ncbi:MAG: helix-turn-helix transcriptional regulator [Clostridia bacterium]|nr:helix-turn-helix transcriptional regulator [Clostridia bacterium]